MYYLYVFLSLFLENRIYEYNVACCLYTEHIGFAHIYLFWRQAYCIVDCPGIHYADQAVLELRDLPASASPVLGLKMSATTPGS